MEYDKFTLNITIQKSEEFPEFYEATTDEFNNSYIAYARSKEKAVRLLLNQISENLKTYILPKQTSDS